MSPVRRGGTRSSRWAVAAAAVLAVVALTAGVLPADATTSAGPVSGTGSARLECNPASEPIPSGPPDPHSPCDENVDPPASSYHPATVHLAAARPFIPLDDYTAAPAGDPVAVEFRQYVNRAVAGHPDWGYSPADAVVQFARSGKQKYLTSAIADVDKQVTRAARAIAQGREPEIAGDSYLEVGPDIEALALTYDWGYSRLTSKQRTRWLRYGNQAVANVWSNRTASWGGRPAGSSEWSGWAINNPGNNYNFSFIQATELWALATKRTDWIEFLQESKFPLITDYYEQLTGGGSREGTGYGTAQTRLWANARTWADATGEHLTAVEDHAHASVDYWIHATVPTLDYYAPFGDLSRESVPNLYDYQENLVREAAMAAPGTPAADRALWWIGHNSVPDDMANSFNLRGALLRPVGTPTKPTALVYDAPGVGQLFARTSWQPEATWLAMIAGPFDESHAHMEQGAFTLYGGDWQAVTSNIWSHSGIQGGGQSDDDAGTGISSIVRFDRPSGPVPQESSTSTMSATPTSGGVAIHADLSAAYAGSEGRVTGWVRDLDFSDGDLVVTDTCTVGAGVTPVWQLHVPTQPTDHGNGTVTAGGLTLSFDPAYGVDLVRMKDVSDDFIKGWRIELTNPAACGFEVAIAVA